MYQDNVMLCPNCKSVFVGRPSDDEAEKAESEKEMSPRAIRQDTFVTMLILIFVIPILVIMFIPNMKNTTKYLSLGILVMISLGIIGLVGYFKGKKF
jgi:hypothetical protein